MERLSNKEGRICEEVMHRIAKRRVTTARTASAMYGGLLIFGAAALVPAFQYAVERASQSGFSSYISLIASDGLSLAGSFGSLSMSIVESAPIMGGIFILALLLACAYAAKKLVRALPLVTAGLPVLMRA